ncbi:MAG: iron chaperone [Moraxellaceae bacterium]
MTIKPDTIAGYIENAPEAGRPHLRRLHEILKEVAPEAEEAIKWGVPFFIEPRFVFSFSAHKTHLNFAPMSDALLPFREELAQHKTTKNFLQVPYTQPLPEDLIRRIATQSLKLVQARKDDSFW